MSDHVRPNETNTHTHTHTHTHINMKKKYELQWVGNGYGMQTLRLLYVGGSFNDRINMSIVLIPWQWIVKDF